ncbi:extracellular solute-binding protein [Paenibacillus sedimenti]|uniref:Extracellular solute-binding protein n=1 Tax=Paenibacillus sedimenti TaxID=2770274 RepID=A0A926KW92_9BACL|nr:extracellular solute-binding protein [Paenibacillus sedimenti]MBD0384051.1 extracellular solute-binding protein [Paenibacillus sedimenti]
MLGTLLLASSALAACSGSKVEESKQGAAAEAPKAEDNKPYPIKLVINQVGEIPPKDSELEKQIESYTNTDLDIQWLPASAYDEKINVMVASGELPTIIKLNNNPTVTGHLRSGIFWEIGPYLKDYKNLTAQNKVYYDNLSVEGKLYGIPLYRDLGRAQLQYRKDWLDALGLQPPKTLDDWYNVIKAMTLNDPDKNGKNDTYGLLLEKKYNLDAFSTLTRLAVTQGAPNKWSVDDKGNFTPEFMTEPFFQTLQMLKRLYAEKLINQDFAAVDTTETEKQYESGRAGIKITAGNAYNWQLKVEKVVPTAKIDVSQVEGVSGVAVPAEPGNAGSWAIPKAAVKTEAELKKVLSFIDKLMDPKMATLLVKGVEGKHWKDAGEFTEVLDRDADLKEVKPYRDTFPNRGESYNIAKKAKQPDLFLKSSNIPAQNEKYIVPNPAYTLLSDTFSERGKELELMITDAETKFIMGKLDEAGWKADIEKWKKAGGEKMMQEYKEAYEKSKKK